MLIIYIIFNNILQLNIGLNIIISITIYLILYYLLLKSSYKSVKKIKNGYLAKFPSEKTLDNKIYIKQDEELMDFLLKI